MSTCRLITCEKTSHWAAALRAALAGGPPALVETRSWADCQAALAAAPASLVAIEVTPANLEAALDAIGRIGQKYPQSRVATLLAPDLLAAEMLLREAGAIEVIGSVLAAPRLARLARRLNSRAPQGELTIQEFVNSRLPWPGLATA